MDSKTVMMLAALTMLAGLTESQASTEVGGALRGNERWSVEGSPYRLVQNLEVSEGVTLEIEPGVRIESKDYDLYVRGTLIAKGTPAAPIRFTSLETEMPGSWGPLVFLKTAVSAGYDSAGNYRSGSVLRYCHIEYGQGIVVKETSPLIEHCLIQKNSRFKEHGGGVLVYRGNPLIRHCRFLHNRTDYNGGGICAYFAPEIRIEDNIFEHNSARSGGAIATGFHPSVITGNTIRFNHAISGGGIAAGVPAPRQSFHSGYKARPLVKNNTISHNSAKSQGGGFFAQGSPHMVANIVTNNQIELRKGRTKSTGEGSGIYLEHAGEETRIERNYIAGNRNAQWGGGICIEYGEGKIHNNILENNTSCSLYIKDWWGDYEISGNFFLNEKYNVLFSNLKRKQRQPWKVTLNNNCFLTGAEYTVSNWGKIDIHADRNWWGTEGDLAIQKTIYDYFDNSRNAKVLVTNPLSADQKPALPDNVPQPNDLSALSPTEVVAKVEGLHVNLSWSGIKSFPVDHYRVHVSKNSQSFDNAEVIRVEGKQEWDSEFAEPEGETSRAQFDPRVFGGGVITICRPRTTDYYRVKVLAVDKQGNLSAFSESVSFEVHVQKQTK
ncbi:MAG: right-handed parallel beta-helix repeat-containing protein [bacterium]|nr:right-handed parallel beta-helix repeat-containing protein [bacterium]